MRHMRPWGDLGLLFTKDSLVAGRLGDSSVGGRGMRLSWDYLGLRLAMTWLIGARGLRDQTLRGKIVAAAGMGRHGVSSLARQLRQKPLPVARR